MEKSRIPLMDGWRFAVTEDPRAAEPDFDDSGWRRVDLPHDWQIETPRREDAPREQGFYPREGVGVYRLGLFAPESWRGKCVRVLFDGIQRFSEVYLNGAPVGGRPYGYVPVMCELTDALSYGRENTLAVRVDNRDAGGWVAKGGDRWYSGAGIYRSVWLLVQERSHIAHGGVRVTAQPQMRGPKGDVPDVDGIRCDRADVRVAVETEGVEGGGELYLEIFSPGGERVYFDRRPAGERAEFDFTLNGPELWSCANPALYRAEVSLLRDGAATDVHTVTFGVRSAVFDSEEGFLLNARRMKLWGVNLHHDGGAFGAAAPAEVWRRRLTRLKALGVNTVRASHGPMAEEVYDLCDELGIMVVDELYDKWDRSSMYYDAFHADWWRRDLEDMVRRDANHPSVILWSMGNEVRGQYSEHFFQRLRQMCDACRELDPTRPVTDVLIGFVTPEANDTTPLGRRLELARRYADIVDVFACNYMEQFYERLRESGMRKPVLGAEVRTYYRGDSRFADTVNVSAEGPYETVKRHDWVAGAILWAGVDYLGESPFWPLRGWTGDILDSTGEPKLRAWYCAAQWKTEPVLKIAVFDESEPWDGARGMWGFPQMRRHWSYGQFEKVMHVGVFTNCDTVKLYQNSQLPRTGFLSDYPDGMVHFRLPFIPGVLRAEGYIGGMKVCEDAVYSDHAPARLVTELDRDTLPADGRSVAFLDVSIEDSHGIRWMLGDPEAAWSARGVEVTADNGDAWHDFPRGAAAPLHNGHILLALRAGRESGQAQVTVSVDGFAPRTVPLTLI